MVDSISGELIRVSPQNKNILAFVSFNSENTFCSNAAVLIPGLTDGMMTLSYTHSLNGRLISAGYSLVQVHISSSFNQFGVHTLDTDVQELTEVVRHLVDHLKFKKILLMGHSTGCQDILYFLRHSSLARCVDAIILQGAISDRDDISADETAQALIDEAKLLDEVGRSDSLLQGMHCGAPITAKRYLSLAGRLTPDDMFSNDLTSDELVPILAPVKVPVLLCYSEQDEYVPDMVAQKASSQRIADTLVKLGNARIVERVYLTGDHGLSEEKDYTCFVDNVLDFIRKCNF